MNLKALSANQNLFSRLLLPVILLAVIGTYTSATVFQLVLLDIASSLNTSAGTASTIPAISRFVGVAIGLVISFLSIKYKHKSLLLGGLVLSGVGALGNSVAPNYIAMVISDSFRGAGFVIISAMAFAMIGELIPKEKRSMAIGWMQAAGFIAFLISSPMTTLITGISGWRAVMSWFVFPFALISFILVFLIVPSNTQNSFETKPQYLKAYKQILSNKCALGCFVAYAGNFAAAAFLTYYVSFYRIQFNMPLTYGAIIVMIGAIIGTLSGVIGGKLVNIAGRKRLGVIAGFANGVLIMGFLFMPTFLSSVTLRFLAAFFGSTALVAFASLVIEQVQEYKGTLTSIYSTIGGIGTVIGLTAGGFVLNLYNSYQILMIVLGSFGFVSTIFFLLLAKEPAKKPLLIEEIIIPIPNEIKQKN